MSRDDGKGKESNYRIGKTYLVKLFSILFVIFAITCFSLYSFTDNVNSKLTEKAAINSAEIYIKALEEFRTIYTSEVVNTAKLQGMEITHDYHNKSNAIPLPATLSMLLGDRMGGGVNGTATRLYSPFPFPWREDEGGLKDNFSNEAWKFLQTFPQQTYSKFEENEQGQFLRYAKADLMRASCVDCHNSHESTPKDDWKVGDVRGILEVTLPLTSSTTYSKESLLNLFWLLVVISLFGIATISFYSIRVRRATQRLAENSLTKERQNALNTLFTGEQTLNGLANKILSYLAPVIHANQAALFLSDAQKEYHLVGSYAVEAKNLNKTSYKLGQGLVGQCAQEEISLTIDAIPNDYMKVTSGLGEASPKLIWLFPVKYKNNVIAVLEFATLSSFDDNIHAILAPLLDIISTALHTSKSRSSIDNLLKVNQQQVSELKVQQEELTSANQVLEEQTLQLRQSENELKASEEELKLQSDELKASNEELEENQHELTTSNDDLEQQRRVLERQSNNLLKSKILLEEKAEQLTLASKYKSEFLANMSHELRTPLNSLLILSKSLYENKQGNLTSVQVEESNIVYQGGQTLLTLINDIMDLSKVEAGMLNINIDAFLPGDVCEDIEALFRPLAQQKNVSFEIHIDPRLNHVIKTDKVRLEQVLKNFLSNAFKFTASGSVRLDIHPKSANQSLVFSSGLIDEHLVCFSVTDSGIGIPEQKQKDIFEAFQQADGSTSRKYGGTGLGLTISKELANLLGGEITMTSTPNRGSCFTLTLPITFQENTFQEQLSTGVNQTITSLVSDKLIDNTQLNKAGELALMTSPVIDEVKVNDWLDDDRYKLSNKDKTLLLIEDDKGFSQILIAMIHSLDLKVIATNKGRDGIMLAQEYLPQGILLDLGLPDITGLKVLEQLKHNLLTRHIPVHVISASDNKMESLHMGALSYLQKPADAEVITSTLQEVYADSNAEIKRILVIEDDQGSQQAIKHLISTEDTELSFASSAKEACELLVNPSFDCIILDLGLPDQSGTELVKVISEQPGAVNVPIIIYTGQDITQDEYRILNQFTPSIVIKGAESPERLLDDVTLFLHHVGEKYSNKQQQTLQILHDENAMLAGRKILVVDDDMRNVFAITRILEQTGIEVIQAENGQVALGLLDESKQPIELILMDIMMPVMDGLEAMAHIRQMEKYKSIPIIALTAKAMPGDRHQCIEAGASEYLTKPLDMDKVLSMLRVWLYRRVVN